jgi:hypothetical protein
VHVLAAGALEVVDELQQRVEPVPADQEDGYVQDGLLPEVRSRKGLRTAR